MLSWHHILLATDFSPCSERATEVAIELARKFDAKLTLVHVWEVPIYPYSAQTFGVLDFLTPIEQAANQELAQLITRIRERVPQVQATLRRVLQRTRSSARQLPHMWTSSLLAPTAARE
jgi:nucleotide-binding universal stress UspA family protein